MKKYLLFGGLLFFLAPANAQVEFSHLSTRGYNSFGSGTMFSYGLAVSPGDAITFDVGILFFRDAIVDPGSGIGFRYTFNRKGDGFYLEPEISFAYSGVNIPNQDSARYPLLRDHQGNFQQPDLDGLVPFLTAGYIFPGRFALNIGLRYGHIFTLDGDPGVDIFSLRLSHTIVFGRQRFH